MSAASALPPDCFGIGEFLHQRFDFGALLGIIRQLPQEVLVTSHQRFDLALTQALGSVDERDDLRAFE